MAVHHWACAPATLVKYRGCRTNATIHTAIKQFSSSATMSFKWIILCFFMGKKAATASQGEREKLQSKRSERFSACFHKWQNMISMLMKYCAACLEKMLTVVSIHSHYWDNGHSDEDTHTHIKNTIPTLWTRLLVNDAMLLFSYPCLRSALPCHIKQNEERKKCVKQNSFAF